MKQNQYNYTRKVGRITYSIVVREAEEAKEKVDNRIKTVVERFIKSRLGGA